MAVRNPVRMVNRRLPGIVKGVPAASVKHWRRVGWRPVEEVEAKLAESAATPESTKSDDGQAESESATTPESIESEGSAKPKSTSTRRKGQ